MTAPISPLTLDDISELRPEEKSFLLDQGIPPTLIFNAAGYKRSQYQQIMEDRDLLFAFNAGVCQAGHKLRSRSGHCVICRAAVIAYTLRHTNPGFVYITESVSKRLLKIGTSTDVQKRMKGLNSYSYGGASDWHEIGSWYSNKSGAVEFIAHQKLSSARTVGTYQKNGELIECSELFQCSITIAINAINSALHEIT